MHDNYYKKKKKFPENLKYSRKHFEHSTYIVIYGSHTIKRHQMKKKKKKHEKYILLPSIYFKYKLLVDFTTLFYSY